MDNLLRKYALGEEVDEDLLYEGGSRVRTKVSDPSKKRVRKESYISANKKAAKRALAEQEEEVY